MPRLEDIRARSTWAQLIEGQPQHLAIALLMALGAGSLLSTPQDAPRLMGLTATGWGMASIMLALLHQIIVASVFRLQLHRNIMTRLFGKGDMKIWAMVFMPLLVLRPVTLIMTGWADTVPITGFRNLEIALGLALLAAAIWAMHSVIKYFSIPRALGGDHFREHYAEMPLVNKGAFRVTSNAMYGVAFLGLWGIALLFGSRNALVVALFQHAYIWVHMYCTEAPDMAHIYPPKPDIAKAGPDA
ncbi:methyltransferase [Profundibacter sp.]